MAPVPVVELIVKAAEKGAYWDKSSGFDHMCDADAYSTIGAFPKYSFDYPMTAQSLLMCDSQDLTLHAVLSGGDTTVRQTLWGA